MARKKKDRPHYLVRELMESEVSPERLAEVLNEQYANGYRVVQWSWDLEMREACFVLFEDERGEK